MGEKGLNLTAKEVTQKSDEQLLKVIAEGQGKMPAQKSLSKEEQKQRLLEREKNPIKSWKLSVTDWKEREHWDDYTAAYEDALNRCSTKHAQWFIVPADKKWFRNLAVAEIMLETLESMKMKFPKPSFDPSKLKLR